MKPEDDSAQLPALWASPAERLRREATAPEVVLYARRPGLGALPEGGSAVLGFAGLACFPIGILLWAVWWPAPTTWFGEVFAVGCTVLILGLALLVLILLIRPRGEALAQLAFVPFIRLVVTDRRVMWTLPWRRAPLFQIEASRVRGGLIGRHEPSRRGGWAPAAIVLWPGDPAGDEQGLVHFDRLPDAAGFVDALARLG